MIFRGFNQSGTNGIEVDISGKLLAIAFHLHQKGTIPSLKQVPGTPSLHIIVGSIGPIQMMKDLRYIASRSFQEKVIMILQEAVDVNDCAIPFVGGFEIGEEFLSVPIISEDRFSLIAPRGYMIECPGELDSEGPRQ